MRAVSPMNPANNVNGFPPIRREDVLTLDKSGPLLAVQEAVARHLVAAVAGFDNVYIEICNEPYATQVPDDWQRRMTTVAAEAVAKLPQPVLLSQNVSNQGKRVVDPHPAISIFNFHYATPPDTIAWNAHLGRLIGDNETGFRGTAIWPTAPRAGTSSWPAAASTTTSITRSRSAAKTGRSCSRRRSRAAAASRCGGNSASCAGSSIASIW